MTTAYVETKLPSEELSGESRQRTADQPAAVSRELAVASADGDLRPAGGDDVDSEIARQRHALTRQVERTLPSLLRNALRFTVSRSLEVGLQRMADRTLHETIGRALAAAPEGALPPDLEDEVEDRLHLVVQEIVAGVLTGATGGELATHGQHALGAALRGDSRSAHHEAGVLLSSLAEVTARVLKDHRKDLVGIAVPVLTRATVGGTIDKVKEGGHVDGVQPERAVQAQDEPVQEAEVAEASRPTKPAERKHERKQTNRPKKSGREIRDQLTSVGETLKQQLAAGSEELQDRLKQGMKSAAKQGMQNQKLGRAPSGGHPSGGNRPRRGPSQRAPGTRRKR